MTDLIKRNAKFIILMIIVIVLGVIGVAYAVKVSNFNPIALNVISAPIDVNITYDSGANGANITSNGKMVPISDNLVTGVNVTDERVIKAKFRVNGVSSNPNNTIYDVALRDISVDCDLRTEDVKWRLYKNGNLLSSGNLSPTFDVISDNRLVLTQTQQDLTTATDEYVFLMWISESCTGDISTCTSELDQSKYLNKSFSGSIKVELSTKSKKTLVRNTGSANSCSFSTTSVPIFNTLTYTGGSQVLVNDGNGYTLINNIGTNASEYAVTAKLNDGYKWADGTTDDKIIKGKINKRAATIIASNQSISSGASVDNTKYTTIDLLSGHTVSSVFLDASTVKVGVGSITPTRASIIDASGNDVTDNYDISYVGGTLTIGCSNDSSITTTLPSSLTYGTGGTYSYTTSPSNLIVSCTSSNTSIATCSVDTSSKKITITPKGTGSVNITLTGTNPNISNECSSVSTSKAITINCSNTATEPTVNSSQNYTGSIITGVTGGTNVTLGGTVSATNAGTYSGTATPSKGYCWNDKTTSTKSYSWAINKAASTCTISSTPTLKYPGASTGNISYSCTGDGNISLNSSNTNVISVGNIGSTSTTLTAKSTGNSTITLKRNEGTNYLASSTVTKSITVSASTYTLTYNNNGGSGCSSKTVTYGSTYGTMCTPTRSGYIFIGWFDSNYKNSPLNYYADTYADLKNAFGYDADKLYNHYLTYGQNENRRISQYISSDTYNTAGNKTLYAGWALSSVEQTVTTYSCPAGYTCSGGTCNSSSKCEKTVTGEISQMYYCSHNKSYQTSSTCSYTGWENAAFNLGCSTTTTCSDSTYSCPSGTTLKGTNCYMYNRYSCRSGYTSVKTGYCEFKCSVYSGGTGESCSGLGVCSSSGGGYSCTTSNGHTLGGSNFCNTTNTLYNCYTPATVTENCVTTGKYYAGSYRGCRLVGSDEVTNGFSCSSGNTGNYNDVGTSSCSVSGYSIKRVLDGDCADSLKFDKDGVKYCDTANGYWKGKSCTSGYQFGASAIYKLTCSKTGSLRYYCDVTGNYSTSRPSSCSKVEYADIESSTNTIYVCPVGSSTTASPITESSICTPN